MSNIYVNLHEDAKAIEILHTIYNSFQKGKIKQYLGATEQGKKYLMILSNLASCTEEAGDLKKAAEYINEAIKEGLRIGMGDRIGNNLMEKAYIMELNNDKTCLEIYKEAYFWCILYEDFESCKVMKEHLQEHFENLSDFVMVF
jgi:hypothetical protein